MRAYFKVGKLYYCFQSDHPFQNTLFILSHKGGSPYDLSYEIVDVLDREGSVIKRVIMSPRLWEEIG